MQQSSVLPESMNSLFNVHTFVLISLSKYTNLNAFIYNDWTHTQMKMRENEITAQHKEICAAVFPLHTYIMKRNEYIIKQYAY